MNDNCAGDTGVRTRADDSGESYLFPAKFFHWSLALLLPVQIGLGWFMLSIEDQPGSGWYFALHVSLGLTGPPLDRWRPAAAVRPTT